MKKAIATSANRTRKRVRARRTSEREQQAFKEALEAVAFKLFVDEGFKAVSIRKIAAAVGCSPMTVYLYHANKQQLLRSLWRHVFADLDQYCERAAESATTASTKVEAYIRAWLEFWLERPDSFRLVFWNSDTSEPSEGPYFADDNDVQAMRAAAATLIAQAHGTSAKEVTDSRVIDVILALLVGYLHLSFAAPELGWAQDQLLREKTVRSALSLLQATNA